MFAFAGFSALPEVRDIFQNLTRGNFRQAILISLLLIGVFYAIFIFTIIGISGANTTEDALAGIASVLGQGAFLVGSFVGFLAVFTSFIALGVDLKYNTFICLLVAGADVQIYSDSYIMNYCGGFNIPILNCLSLDILYSSVLTNDKHKMGVGGRLNLIF